MTTVDEFNINVTNQLRVDTVVEYTAVAGISFNNNVFINDQTDTTKKLRFNMSGITTANTRVLTIPDASTTVVGTDVSQTLTNKALVNASTFHVDGTDNTKRIAFQSSGNTTAITLTVASQQSTSQTASVPNITGADTFVMGNVAQTLSNKSLVNANTFHVDGTDNTKRVAFQSSGATTGTTLTIADQQTTSQTASVPNITGADIFVMGNVAQTLSNKSLVNANTFHVDGTDNTKRIAFQSSGATTGTTSTIAGAQTANRVLTLPDVTDTLAGVTATQTLTNKTLTSPTISTIVNTGTLTLPTTTDTLVGRITTDTFTNKTIIDSTNNVAANSLKTTGAVVNVAAAAPPTTGQVLTASSATTANWQNPSANAVVVTFTANGTVTTGFAVMLDTSIDSRVIHATGANGHRVIGVALNSATVGQSVNVQMTGIVNLQIVQTGAIAISRGDRIEISYISAGAGTVNRAINGENVTGPAFAYLLTTPTYAALNQCVLLPHVHWFTSV
jgi:hypothetical protein